MKNPILPKLFSVFLILFILSGCQVYMDPRQEPLKIVTEKEWDDLKSDKENLETQFEIESKPKMPPVAIPGSEDIGFIDATTARLYGCRALTTLKMMYEGPYDHGIIATRNRAFSLAADMMVAGKMGEYKLGTSQGNQVISQFVVELYRCPDAAFEKENTNE